MYSAAVSIHMLLSAGILCIPAYLPYSFSGHLEIVTPVFSYKHRISLLYQDSNSDNPENRYSSPILSHPISLHGYDVYAYPFQNHPLQTVFARQHLLREKQNNPIIAPETRIAGTHPNCRSIRLCTNPRNKNSSKNVVMISGSHLRDKLSSNGKYHKGSQNNPLPYAQLFETDFCQHSAGSQYSIFLIQTVQRNEKAEYLPLQEIIKIKSGAFFLFAVCCFLHPNHP